MSWHRWRKRLKNDFVFLSVALAIRIIRRLPEKAAMGLMAWLGRFAFSIARSERHKTLRHLSWVYGDSMTASQRRRFGRQVFNYLGTNGCAAIRLPRYLEFGLDRIVTVSGLSHLDRALAHGRGVLGITGHVGCWELMAAYLAAKGYPLAVVGKPLYDPRLNALLVAYREKAGLVNIERDGAARRMLRWLRDGKMVGVLIDQDTAVESEFVDFMGRPAKTPIAPMLLAQKAGAAIVPMAIRAIKGGRHHLTILPELDLEPDDGQRATRVRNLSRCSKAVENLILQAPEQWVWMHERWKSRPGQETPSFDAKRQVTKTEDFVRQIECE